jgi:hypothetical protein
MKYIDPIDVPEDLRELRFENKETYQTEFDPRLTSQNLKRIGIRLEDIILV